MKRLNKLTPNLFVHRYSYYPYASYGTCIKFTPETTTMYLQIYNKKMHSNFECIFFDGWWMYF